MVVLVPADCGARKFTHTSTSPAPIKSCAVIICPKSDESLQICVTGPYPPLYKTDQVLSDPIRPPFSRTSSRRTLRLATLAPLPGDFSPPSAPHTRASSRRTLRLATLARLPGWRYLMNHVNGGAGGRENLTPQAYQPISAENHWAKFYLFLCDLSL